VAEAWLTTPHALIGCSQSEPRPDENLSSDLQKTLSNSSLFTLHLWSIHRTFTNIAVHVHGWDDSGASSSGTKVREYYRFTHWSPPSFPVSSPLIGHTLVNSNHLNRIPIPCDVAEGGSKGLITLLIVLACHFFGPLATWLLLECKQGTVGQLNPIFIKEELYYLVHVCCGFLPEVSDQSLSC
jgi:hypothetical protein